MDSLFGVVNTASYPVSGYRDDSLDSWKSQSFTELDLVSTRAGSPNGVFKY